MKSRAEQLMEIKAPGRGLLRMERLLSTARIKHGHCSFIRTDIAFIIAIHRVDGRLHAINCEQAEVRD